jgi:Fur family peroxide stress response transcriptional regulator
MDQKLNERLAARGFRSTSQREHVYTVLLGERDHPTAEQIFLRAKKTMPDISMATVYNCLDTLVKAGLARQVNLDRTAMRYCPNMGEHCHFYCGECGGVYDIDVPADGGMAGISIPKGYRVNRFEVAIHGACPKCAKRKRFNDSTI